jgi:hypothetical protein
MVHARHVTLALTALMLIARPALAQPPVGLPSTTAPTDDDPGPDRSADQAAITLAVDRGRQPADDAGTAAAAAAHPADRSESRSAAGSAHHAVHGRPPHRTPALTTEAARSGRSPSVG